MNHMVDLDSPGSQDSGSAGRRNDQPPAFAQVHPAWAVGPQVYMRNAAGDNRVEHLLFLVEHIEQASGMPSPEPQTRGCSGSALRRRAGSTTITPSFMTAASFACRHHGGPAAHADEDAFLQGQLPGHFVGVFVFHVHLFIKSFLIENSRAVRFFQILEP